VVKPQRYPAAESGIGSWASVMSLAHQRRHAEPHQDAGEPLGTLTQLAVGQVGSRPVMLGQGERNRFRWVPVKKFD
jgi:hypothetical protein